MILLFLPFFITSEVYFEERFGRGWDNRWTKSSRSTPGNLLGRFRVSAGSFYYDRRIQRGLQTVDNNREYLISSKFNKCFNTTGKDLIFQFSVKLENKMEKGQAYIKLFPESFNQGQFSKKSPFSILFGPDFNGWARKHLDFRITRNKTVYNTYQPIVAFDDQFTHVYTLIIYKNQTYKILKDNYTEIESSLENAFCYCQPKEIPDPFEEKPKDWVDDEFIDDPDDQPPEYMKNMPKFIQDLTVKRPKNWDDKINGIWTPPLIPNPDYNNKWEPRKIPNPEFKGIWEPKTIQNPDYNPDLHFGKPENLCYLGIDVTQDVSGCIWNNILVTDDFEYSQKVMEETFFSIQEGERYVFLQNNKGEILKQNNEDVVSKNSDSLPSDL